MTTIYRFRTLAILFVLLIGSFSTSQAQRRKLLRGGERNLEMYQCGYVFEPKLKDRLNPMRAMQNALGNAFTAEGRNDLGDIAISVFYQAHLHPQEIMRYPTQTPGWQTCGDAVYLGMTNRGGVGLANTDGEVSVAGQVLEDAGIGTYFTGFSSDERGEKAVRITSSDGDQIDLTLLPAEELQIISVNGTPRGEATTIDGSTDVVIELENGDADPTSLLHVSMISKSVGTPIMYDVYVSPATNRLVIPATAFYNYEGSPTPFMKENTLIVNRVREEVLDGTDAGAIRTLSCFMDWTPIEVEGQIAKGSIMTAGFDSSRNTQINLNLLHSGDYTFSMKKGNPFSSPPVSRMKRVAVASFVVRGNLEASETTYSTVGGFSWETTVTKWFPEVSQQSWQALADQMYERFATQLVSQLGVELVPIEEVVGTKAYQYIKPIKDEVTKTYVEVGAGGSERILTTTSTDLFTDLSISFPSDFVGDRIARELGVDAVVAVTIDLNLQMESEGLDPKVSLAFFAPNLGYKAKSTYFEASGTAQARSLKEAAEISGGATRQLYEMIHADQLVSEFFTALAKLQEAETQTPAYNALWKNR